MKKQTSFFLLFIFIFSNAFSQDIERRTLTMGPFYGVKVFSKLDIKLIPSEVNKAIIYGDHKDEVILSLKNKMIKIKLASKSVLNLGYTYIELYHSEPLDRIVAHQGVTLTTEAIEQTSLKVEAKSGAIITLEANVDRLDAVSNSAGRIHLKGQATNFNLSLSSSGSCEAEELLTEQSQVKSYAGGYAHINASELVDAKIIGGGVLRVYGSPKKQVTQTNLGGKIIIEE